MKPKFGHALFVLCAVSACFTPQNAPLASPPQQHAPKALVDFVERAIQKTGLGPVEDLGCMSRSVEIILKDPTRIGMAGTDMGDDGEWEFMNILDVMQGGRRKIKFGVHRVGEDWIPYTENTEKPQAGTLDQAAQIEAMGQAARQIVKKFGLDKDPPPPRNEHCAPEYQGPANG